MKRDMDLVRDLLLAIEGSPHAVVSRLPEIEGYTADTVRYHALLLLDASYLAAVQHRPLSGPIVDPRNISLTWQGHELLDSIRDEEIWRRTKSGARKIGGFSIELLKELALSIAKAKAKELGFDMI